MPACWQQQAGTGLNLKSVSASAWLAALGDKHFFFSALGCSSVLFIVILVVAVGAKWSRECFAVWLGFSLHPPMLPDGALFLSCLPPTPWANTLSVLLFFANTLFNGKRLSNCCCQVHPGLYEIKYLFFPLHKQPPAVFRPAAWESKLREGWYRQARSCPMGSGPASWCGELPCVPADDDGASQPAGKARAQAALTPGRGGHG